MSSSNTPSTTPIYNPTFTTPFTALITNPMSRPHLQTPPTAPISRPTYAPQVLSADELYVLMGAGAVFSGFVEPPVTFPPTYKRCKGPRGECGDYTGEEE